MEETLVSQPTDSPFVDFPDKDAVLAKLRSVESSETELDPLWRLIAERLAEKAYDRSAFAFILIELVYEFEEVAGVEWGKLLHEIVMVLTEDEELAASTLEAYHEIKASLEPEAPEPKPEKGPETEHETKPTALKAEPESSGLIDAPPAPGAPVGTFAARRRSPEQERLMLSLQDAQKEIVDMGLATRMSIDMALSRPNHESVNHTLREISALRDHLEDFEKLLRESETRILEKIGVLDREED